MDHSPETNPAALSPEHRRHEIAAILARGIHRLREMSSLPVADRPAPNLSDSSRIGLDVPAKSSPDAIVR